MPRALSRLLLVPLVVVGSNAGCGRESMSDVRAKNLLFLCVDTLRPDHLGAYGASPSPSPAIDELARSGIVFERAYAHASWTLPSFAAILTSLYSSTHGCWTFKSSLSESFATLPERFQEAGFDTYGIASHVYFNREYGLQQGFDAFDDEFAHKYDEAGWIPITSPRVSEKAVRWLEERVAAEDRDPWLLWLHYFDPHVPYVDHARARTGVETPDEHARYVDEIAFTDRYVGEVLVALERLGLAGETVVVFLSDHGEAFEEHPGVRRHSKSLFDEELRVPLVVRVPGLEARRVSAFVRTVDLHPTLFELFRIPLGPAPIEGRSLVSALLGEELASPRLLAEIRLHDGFHARAIVDGRWKLVEDTSNDTTRLYDLVGDPGETQDLAGERPELAAELRAEMESLEGRAREASGLYEGGREIELSPETLERLRELGYAGVDEEDTEKR